MPPKKSSGPGVHGNKSIFEMFNKQNKMKTSNSTMNSNSSPSYHQFKTENADCITIDNDDDDNITLEQSTEIEQEFKLNRKTRLSRKRKRVNVPNENKTFTFDEMQTAENRDENKNLSTTCEQGISSKTKGPIISMTKEIKPLDGYNFEATETYDAGNEEDDDYTAPYYLENFNSIINNVLEDSYYNHLIINEDQDSIDAFNTSTEPAQKLYVRLFQRKYRWLRKSQIEYPKIAVDLSDILEELVAKELLLGVHSLTSLEEGLLCLSAPGLKALAKTLKLNANQTRIQLISAIMRHSKKKHLSGFFHSSSKEPDNTQYILKRVKEELGDCYKLSAPSRKVFLRILMLFNLHNINFHDDESPQQQIFQLLMTNIGQIKYPKYSMNRMTKLFNTRDDLLEFETAVHLESDMREAIDTSNLDAAFDIYNDAFGKYKIYCSKSTLPLHLQKFTAGASLTNVLSLGVDVLQKKRDYESAVELLQLLISKSPFKVNQRGIWYERLALNLDQHLKQRMQAIHVIKDALKDSYVRAGHRLAIFQRAERICNSEKSKPIYKELWQDFQDDQMANLKVAPKVFIKARQLPRSSMSVPAIYMLYDETDDRSRDDKDVTLLTRVEQVALEYYRKKGYCHGLHAEGSIFTLFFSLFFWDIIFCDDIPDVFISKFQSFPLDLHSDSFYTSRQDKIDSRLAQIEAASIQDLQQMLEDAWTSNEGTNCIGVKWDLFESVAHAKQLVQCIGGGILSKIFTRFVKCYRSTRSGLPDLTVWNHETKVFKLVEVKGPGDRLSTKQMLWLDYFMQIDAPAEVCHVEAISARKIL